MTEFSLRQQEALLAPLSREHVRERDGLSYIEGWHAIAEANRIFGYDAWNRETVATKCVSETADSQGRARVAYLCRVRITVGTIVREGFGAGTGINKDIGKAHESAVKEAETDAMKRALMTFGNSFGLALYDKEQRNVVDDAPAQPKHDPWATQKHGDASAHNKAVKDALLHASGKGTQALIAAWSKLPSDTRRELERYKDEVLKPAAADADAQTLAAG